MRKKISLATLMLMEDDTLIIDKLFTISYGSGSLEKKL